MKNAEKFKEIFKEFATEVWAFPEKDFLTWLNTEYEEPTTENDLGVDIFDKAINQSDLEEWIMETFPDWCEGNVRLIMNHMDEMPSVTPQEPRCKDCKWWKDSDGNYRRGCRAESHCHINTDVVYRGEGYCYMFSPKTDMRGVEE